MPGTEWLAASVVGVSRMGTRFVRLRLDVHGWPGHLAGQHCVVRLTADDGYTAQRSYSIASAPADPLLELLVEHVPGGEVSGWFAEVARPGDTVELRGPIGLWFAWDGTTPAVGVGGGTGVVPLVAMLRHAPERMTVVAAARTLADLPYAAELQAAGATVVLSRQDLVGQGSAGRPAARLGADDLPALRGVTAYVCGSPAFAEAASQLAAAAGADVRVERFGASG